MATSGQGSASPRLHPVTRALARLSPERGGVGLIDHPLRPLAPDEVELQVSLCGLCGADMVVYDADPDFGWVRPGTVLGQEAVGVVGKVGLLVPEAISPGIRVVTMSTAACGRCGECRGGNPDQCQHKVTLGLGRHGTAAGRALVPWNCLVPVPDGLPDESAVLAEPASMAWRAVADVARVGSGERVAVSTTRAAGLLAALMAKCRGAEVTMVGRPGPEHEAKAQLAAELGLRTVTDPKPDSFDVWIEASGSGKQLGTALETLRPGGKLVLVAMYSSGRPEAISGRTRGDLSVLTSYSSTRADFEHALHFLETVPWLGERVITLFPMGQAVEALRLTAESHSAYGGRPLIKAVLQPGRP